MLGEYYKKVFGSRDDREVKKIQPRVQQINDLESRISALTDEQLQARTPEFKQRFENGRTATAISSSKWHEGAIGEGNHGQ